MFLKLIITKKVSLFLIFIFFAGFTIAQKNVTGIKIGYNSSKFVGSAINGSNHDNMPGFYMGGLFLKKLSKFDLQFEMLLTTKGYQVNSIGDTYISNLLIYLEMPALIRKEILSKNKLGVYVLGGPSFMWKILSINLVSEIDGIKNIDAGAILGLGLQISKLSFEVRLNQSFVNFDLIEPSKYNQVVSVGLNFYFK